MKMIINVEFTRMSARAHTLTQLDAHSKCCII